MGWSGAEEGVEGWLAGVRLQKAVNRREDGDMYRAGSYYESGCTGTCLRRKKKRREDARLNEGRCCNRAGGCGWCSGLRLPFAVLSHFRAQDPQNSP